MSQLQEIIEIEKQRADAEHARTLFFYMEGSFYRAYEWSAWLWCRKIRDFSPTHRKVKSIEQTIIHIGCPVSSFFKHLPEGATHTVATDGSVTLQLPETMFPEGIDVQAMEAEFLQWKQSVPVAESAKKRQSEALRDLNDGGATIQPVSLTAVMQQILSFPIEKKSMIECVSFLSDIKTQLAKMV